MTERLAVLLHGRVVGRLERQGHEVPTFTYEPDYVATGRTPLSSRLPIAAETYPSGRVEPYLRGLLPENPQTRRQWAADLATQPDDAFGMLAVMGWDCPGAVQFCPEDKVDSLHARAGDIQRLSESQVAARLRRLLDQPASWTMPGEHWSLAGQQEKFALALIDGVWHEAKGSAATTHIIKPGIKALMHQALIEHVTMRAAAGVGVAMAGSRLLRFDEEWAIVVDRFDRVTTKDGVIRLHQEDFCQALGFMPENKYEAPHGPRLLDMARLVRRQMTRPDEDTLALADFLAINLVTGAPDGHSKNVSLILAPDGTRWIAPLYDLATGLSYETNRGERSVALSVGGERIFSRIRAKQWSKAAEVLGIQPRLMMRRVAMMATAFPAAFERALEDVAHVPGAEQVESRTMGRLREHCDGIVARLGD